jgi:hypothetical protein
MSVYKVEFYNKQLPVILKLALPIAAAGISFFSSYEFDTQNS